MSLDKDFEKKHTKHIANVVKSIAGITDEEINNLAKELSKYDIRKPESFRWSHNKNLENRMTAIISRYGTRVKTSIVEAVVQSWGLSNQKNDLLVNQYLRNVAIAKETEASYFSQNTDALNAFINRTVGAPGHANAGSKGIAHLSKRVWNLENTMKEQIETYIGQGIATGKSADKVSQDVRKMLKYPDKRFRRVNKDGKLVLSKPAKEFKPGAGVYRSSYKNAKRLAQTEINMAYRTADFQRRQQLPFVVGIRVVLSDSHEALMPQGDMCDDLKGLYPKTFIFSGWHPNCLCFTEAVLTEKKDFIQYLNTGKFPKRYYIDDIPKAAKQWVREKKPIIQNYKSTPYFLKDNFDKDFNLSIPKVA